MPVFMGDARFQGLIKNILTKHKTLKINTLYKFAILRSLSFSLDADLAVS